MTEDSKDKPSTEELAQPLAWFKEYTGRLESQPAQLPLRCPCCSCKTLGERAGYEIYPAIGIISGAEKLGHFGAVVVPQHHHRFFSLFAKHKGITCLYLIMPDRCQKKTKDDVKWPRHNGPIFGRH